MLRNVNTDPRDYNCCVLTYEEEEHGLRATWYGFVYLSEAMAGASAYLAHAALQPSAFLLNDFLLNDNTAQRVPWFDPLGWLAAVWVPQATQLGLRYVAHVAQTDRSFDIIPEQLIIPEQVPAPAPFELQIFQDLPGPSADCAACATPTG